MVITPHHHRRATAAVAALALTLVSAVSAGLTATSASASASSDTDSTSTSKQASVSADRRAATNALAAVRAVFAPPASGDARRILDGVDATMALRDLAAGYESLSESDRAIADGYLARPTDSSDGDSFTVEYGIPEATPACSIDLCVHYVTGKNQNNDAPPLADAEDAAGEAGGNGIPDYVDSVLRVMTHVHNTYIDAGYREPLPDKSRGGDDRIDIYLAEIGSRGVYGYCTTDQPNPTSGPAFYDRWAYCVLDDDYAGFPNSALENIQVTAAHEYFHATQYAYDAFEDSWFLEATATWAEDEVYDKVNDNVQYLERSPLTAPFIPVDTFVNGGDYSGFHYGTWSFFRFLTEKYGVKKGTMPRLVLDMMDKVDGSLGAQDQYSWQAVGSVLGKKKTTASRQLLAYSVANRRPRATYDEGRAQKYPSARPAGSITLSPKRSRTGVARAETDHLSAATYRITPANLARKRTKLKVILDMAPKKHGSMAAITVVPKKGRARVYAVKLSRKGNGTKAVPFSSATVRYVEVTMANTSGRTRCFTSASSPFSCYGNPTYDNQSQKLSARVVR